MVCDTDLTNPKMSKVEQLLPFKKSWRTSEEDSYKFLQVHCIPVTLFVSCVQFALHGHVDQFHNCIHHCRAVGPLQTTDVYHVLFNCCHPFFYDFLLFAWIYDDFVSELVGTSEPALSKWVKAPDSANGTKFFSFWPKKLSSIGPMIALLPIFHVYAANWSLACHRPQLLGRRVGRA